MKKAIVVGSGPGGMMAAKELAASFEVTVLEAGKPFAPFGMNMAAFEPLRRAGLFLDERMIQLLFPAMRILKARGGLVHVHGRALGGTSTLATGNAVRCDGALRELGIDLSEEFDEIFREVPVTTAHRARWSKRTEELFEAFCAQGLDPFVTPKALFDDGARCVACGKCVLGCKTGAKWTADKLIEGDGRVAVKCGCEVVRIEFARASSGEPGKATAVAYREDGRELRAEADLVVLAAGGLGTPALLGRSGIPVEPTLFVDPVLCVAAPLENANLDRQLPMPFVSQREDYILSPYFDWLSFYFNGAWRRPSGDIASIMIKLADDSVGSFDGKRLAKEMTPRDTRVLQTAVEECRGVLERLGIAREDMFLGTLNAGHPGGCLPLTSAEAETLHHGILPENLYVADASLLPKAMGNPPILTIMALSKRIARLASARFA